LLAFLVSALVLPPLSLSTATEVAAVGPACSDFNPPNRLDPAPSGRITVLYEANQITDPTALEAEARAVAIVRELQIRADDALDRYEQLGFAVPSSATIHVRCETFRGRDAIVTLPGLVQFKSSYVREQFADAEYNGAGFEPGPWDGACRAWWTTMDHEVFHLVQLETWGPGGLVEYFEQWEFTLQESSATLAQDLFADVDDEDYSACVDPDAAKFRTYLGAADGFLADLPPIVSLDYDSSANYLVAPVYQYWAERYGDEQAPTAEDRVAEMLDRLLRAPGIRERAVTNALGVNVFDAYREFLVAALIRKQPGVVVRYEFQDELLGFGGAGPGQPYADVVVRTTDEGTPISQATPYSDLNQVLGRYGGRVYLLDLDPAMTRATVELTTTPTGGFGPLFQSWSRPKIAVLPIASDGTVAVESQYFMSGSDSGVTEPLTVPVAGRSQLGIVLVSTPDAFGYSLTVSDDSGPADIWIEEPTTSAPQPVGPANDLQRLDVVVHPLVDGYFEPGLDRTAFTVTIGGQEADVLAAEEGTDAYTLRVQPNGPLADGTHELAVTFGGVTRTEPDAVLVGGRPGAAVALVIDRSGSMYGTRIAAAKAAAVSFVQQMQLGDQVALVTFSYTATVSQALVTLTSEAVRDQVIARINAVSASGSTNIAAGLEAGNDQLTAAISGFGRAIVLLSDGQDATDIDSVIATIPADVDAHTIALDSGSDQARLQHIADATGGTFLFAPDSAALAELYARIRALITGTEVSSNGSLGTLGQGAVADASATVAAGTATASFDVRWVGSDFDLTLTSPSGRIITETTTDPDVVVTAGASFVTIAVTAPEAGTWGLHVVGVDVPVPEPVTYRVEESGADARSDIEVSGTTAGLPIVARLGLTAPTGPLLGATVVARVTDPGGATRTFRLFDDGGHADGWAADGIYGGELWATNSSGSYTVVVTATGVDSTGYGFVREEVASIFLGPIIDTDGDGVADATELRFGLDPADPSDGNADFDLDGLGLRDELAAGSHPFLRDTDGAGEPDGAELTAGRSPTDPTDDRDPLSPFVGITPQDGNLFAIVAGTKEGVGTVEISRWDGATTTPLGTFSGSGAESSDGPLPTGDYWYLVTAVSDDGTRSETGVTGPHRAAADVVKPVVKITINDGAWTTANRTVSVALETSEAAVSMRFAEVEGDLASAVWQSFASSTMFEVGPELGFHRLYVQVQDAAGNVSNPDVGIVELIPEVTDATPPISGAGPLDAVYASGSITVPYSATDDASGVAQVELWARQRPNEAQPWSAWGLAATATSSPISYTFAIGDGNYEFYTIAIDGATNREAAPAGADVVTRRDATDDPPDYGWEYLYATSPDPNIPPCEPFCALEAGDQVVLEGRATAADDRGVVSVRWRLYQVYEVNGEETRSLVRNWASAVPVDGAFDSRIEGFSISDSRPPEEVFGSYYDVEIEIKIGNKVKLLRTDRIPIVWT
jgi:uncharacterized protein YegL